MIIRIVRMSFEPEKVNEFIEVFNASCKDIRAFEGNMHLELLSDVQHPNVYFTYSYWEDEAHLNKYRFSELFKNTWAKTKPLFNEKAMAWSLDRKRIL